MQGVVCEIFIEVIIIMTLIGINCAYTPHYRIWK